MAKERVQVQGLGDAVPGIQPTIQRGGQYAVQVQRAGRNKLMDLADALSQVNPILSEFGNIRRIQREQQQAFEKAMLAEGEKAFQLDPTGMTAQLKSFEKQARSLAEKGELPEEANAIRMIGAMRAKAQVLANRDYRATLLNPELLQQTTDPEVAILKQREQFLQREELQSPLVRDSVLEHLFKVEDEFRNKVQDRLDQIDIEDGRRNWLELGRDSIKQAIVGELDINDPSVVNWINHPAGIFKGSRKFAWDNLIKEDLKEGLTTGDYTPTEVLDFVEDLRELDLGGGIKFADADTGNAISDFVGYVEGRRATLENKAKEAINIQFEEVKFDVTDVFYKEVKDTGSVSKDTLMTQMARAVELVPHHKRDQLIADIQGSWANANKLRDEATKVVFDDFVRNIEQGRDLDTTKEELNKAVDSGSITPSDYDKLNTRLENSRDFDVQVIKNPSYIDLKNSYEEIITGFRKDKKLTDVLDKNTVKNYFSTITLDKAETEAGMTTSIYDRIKSKVGEAKAKMFVNRQYRTFDRILRNKLEVEFNKQIGLGRTIEEAKTYIQENQDTIAEKQFEGWVNDSIILAQTVYLK
jgi:hypothetical protein